MEWSRCSAAACYMGRTTRLARIIAECGASMGCTIMSPRISFVYPTPRVLSAPHRNGGYRGIALQITALTGVGYAGGGVIHGAGVVAPGPNGEGARNYHYGLTPESLLALRLIFADRADLDATARNYYISKVGATESTGSETINRLDVALTVRVFDLHGITLRYSLSNREGRYRGLPDSHQRVSVVNLGYTLLGHASFGAVDWREAQASAE